ncbi:MAG: aminotransferase class I/II-fold pyridoxal phosphate-dependent enzyme, partial [Desulfobacteraceae bacterium]
MKYIPVANVITEEDDAQAVYEVVKSGWLSKGKKVDEFEKRFAAAVGARDAIAVNSGTSALHAVLAALDIGPGDEVILPSLTFISTANAVLYQGATPVLVECDPKTYNVTPEILEKAITDRTKAMIPVDMNGLPVDYDAILALGRRRGIPVIADSAESLGA